MKRVYTYMLAIALGAVAGTGCSNDAAEEPQPAAVQGRTITVVASLSDETKAAFTDEEGLRWSAGDVIKWGWSSNTGNLVASNGLTADDISEDGTKATFTITIPDEAIAEGKGWFFSATNHPGNNNEVEFTRSYGYAFTQSEIGIMNNNWLFLHSGTGTMDIPADGESVTMEIPGSIFRIIPYTETYNGEQIEKVTLSASNLTGTVAYYRVYGTYTAPFWAQKDAVEVTLGQPFLLEDVTSRESSKGVYMAIPRTGEPLNGYKYIVETQLASYVFDASDKQLEVGDNVVRNVFLKLENGERTPFEEHAYDVMYEGNLTDVDNQDWRAHQYTAGWWYAQIAPAGTTDWKKRDLLDGKGNVMFYWPEFEYVDESGADITENTWVTCCHRNMLDPAQKGAEWEIFFEENPNTTSRTVTVTATYPDPAESYVVLDAYRTKTIEITQNGRPE